LIDFDMTEKMPSLPAQRCPEEEQGPSCASNPSESRLLACRKLLQQGATLYTAPHAAQTGRCRARLSNQVSCYEVGGLTEGKCCSSIPQIMVGLEHRAS
jgi:hypothetical protein